MAIEYLHICGNLSDDGQSCFLEHGHDGQHTSGDGNKWDHLYGYGAFVPAGEPVSLTVDEAIALTEVLKKQWVVLGVDTRTLHKTYACPRCGRQRITLVTPGAKLPAECPRCKAPLGVPS